MRSIVPDSNDSDCRGTSVTYPAGDAHVRVSSDMSLAEKARRRQCPYDLSPFIFSAVRYSYPSAMILAGETCEVLKTSQVFGEPTHHIHCGCVLVQHFISSDTLFQAARHL